MTENDAKTLLVTRLAKAVEHCHWDAAVSICAVLSKYASGQQGLREAEQAEMVSRGEMIADAESQEVPF